MAGPPQVFDDPQAGSSTPHVDGPADRLPDCLDPFVEVADPALAAWLFGQKVWHDQAPEDPWAGAPELIRGLRG